MADYDLMSRFNIRIGPSLHDSDLSLSDEEGSSGVQVSPPSDSGSQEYPDPYDEWAHLSYPDEVKPSDSASRPRTANRTRGRNPIHGSPSGSGRRHSPRRYVVQERDLYTRRSRRHHSPESPESPDSAEEFGDPYMQSSQERPLWPSVPQGSNYHHRLSPESSYVYSSSGISPGAFAQSGHRPPSGHHPPSDQLIRLGHHHQAAQPAPYNHPAYGYTPHYQNPHGPHIPPFFLHEHHPGHHIPHAHPSPQGRNDSHNPHQQPIAHQVPPHGPSQYGGHPLSPHELMPYGTGGYYPFREPYTMVPGMVHPSYLNAYPRAPSPSQEESSPPSAPAPSDVAKDEAIARLEKLILEERTERESKEAREAAIKAAIEKEAAETSARLERAAHEKKITEEAAAAARAEAEQKAAEEAAKAKKEAEEAAAAAAAEAAAKATEAANAAAAEAAAKATEAANAAAAEAAAKATEAANAAAAEAVAAATAAASNKAPEKKKPIKFKDSIGRKFSFPFDLCCTWQGMEELIRQAFIHIEGIGPHIVEGNYDLVGPDGEIILPRVWETVIEPDWMITMHMWPIPEKPKTPEPAPTSEGAAASDNPVSTEAATVPDNSEAIVAPDDPKKKSESTVFDSVGKKRSKAPNPGALAFWMAGSQLKNRALKAGKKP
ncbi:uncharacterized protein ACLA_005340 [Aspergillus clavatus NRRL 1]|uniref:Ubiquitin-like domain-containing protein n=1 Tax=Aspergillus clavatus (strain ATCC 1007 / CBS 513.65 / DSM 816 / NCTC 3887 / NRRL 1 / QM 1276 / 107) TaxID=344612 RepID=A1CD54_ASPCL|nr:uncharacterized protein ACLA_005340 [Aspergillus clavatus NRRL 1]EAW11781.1 hypothetical protein ACLA_005340 [Aspergillus clavatus NRRL 1]